MMAEKEHVMHLFRKKVTMTLDWLMKKSLCGIEQACHPTVQLLQYLLTNKIGENKFTWASLKYVAALLYVGFSQDEHYEEKQQS